MAETPPKSKQSGRSSIGRRLSTSSRASSVMSQLQLAIPESDVDAKWRKYLVELLGEEGADYFINPKPKEHRVIIDQALYQCHGLDDAWLLLRDKADTKIREKLRNSKKGLRSCSTKSAMDDDEDLDRAYFAYGRYLLSQKGRVLPPRIFSEKADVYKHQLEKLSDRHARVQAARYNQETGVSYRSACVNTDRCAHLIEQATNKGQGSFYSDRKSEGAVFAEDFSEYEGSEPSNSYKESSYTPSLSSSVRRRTARPPKFIFLTAEEAAEEAEQLAKLWSRQKDSRDALSPMLANASKSAGRETTDFTPTVDKWEPLGLSAAAEWGKVISKS